MVSICPPTGTGVKHVAEDLFEETHQQFEVDFENEGGETFICGNPPYIGDKKQKKEQKAEIEEIAGRLTKKWRSLDYVCGWLLKAKEYVSQSEASIAFVTTNSITQGQQVPVLWPLMLKDDAAIFFAYLSFKWSNLAIKNAGVMVVVIGISNRRKKVRRIYRSLKYDETEVLVVDSITPYLLPGKTTFVESRSHPISDIPPMLLGNFAKDDGHLLLAREDLEALDEVSARYVYPMYGGQEFIKGHERFCFWIDESEADIALESEILVERFNRVRESRLKSPKKETRGWASAPYRFVEIRSPKYQKALILPIVSSENRNYFPVGLLPPKSIVNYAFGLYDAPLWSLSIIASTLHLCWISTVCGKMKTDYRYSNTLGWNTFPVPTLTEKNKEDLTRCAENILLAREAHFPKTIADLYDPEKMPENLRQAHEENDEVLERIYIGRRFRNDTERLEKLFDMYTKMTANNAA